MAYKTILTVLTSASQKQQLEAAIALARQQDAHLDVFCLGVDHTQSGYYYAGASAYVFQEAIDKAMQAAAELEQKVSARLTNEDIRWSVDSAVAQVGGLTTLIGMRARYSDLVLLNRPYGPDATPDAEAVTEAALFEGGAPVLIAPDGLERPFGRRILIAWNQSNEAMTAVRRALPLLIAADAVEITVIAPSPHGPERSDPGGALCQMLTRHGVKAEIAVLAKTEPQISDMIIRRVTEIGADMVVMGAYGHSRFRQAILGGATRNMLEKAQVPVLMAR
ncbi:MULTISPECIES: universal stress protein [unclassified Paracoccus (in: a-proteobacteria)]|uniref:universal stress protein n=1 Tax=unclassified Paracoccus (in: a-proteobacteria) TaxID=2688777 RepID=UPI0012B37809|nr:MULTISPECIES: universal stress protein [unclassified Paracoccus (in: a-proteobacteria)]UXU76371.1 universal stress protein [Paracoccus sp. SMMA_5]UXU82291.1 universal stress protein [Paracoccus sp. SMMA_5_TC]